jgi:prepilin-type N-terminal cleavage/methylation domain-containing protein
MIDRRGFTLIEMLAALTIGSVVLGISVSMLALLLRVERLGREHVQQDGVTVRLAEQFRDDAHAALPPAPTDARNKGPWRFVLASDRTVTYRALPEAVDREEAVAGKRVRYESYTLPAGWAARVLVAADGKPPLASLIVTSTETPRRTDGEVRIDAVLGRDQRFTTTSPGGSR